MRSTMRCPGSCYFWQLVHFPYKVAYARHGCPTSGYVRRPAIRHLRDQGSGAEPNKRLHVMYVLLCNINFTLAQCSVLSGLS